MGGMGSVLGQRLGGSTVCRFERIGITVAAGRKGVPVGNLPNSLTGVGKNPAKAVKVMELTTYYDM